MTNKYKLPDDAYNRSNDNTVPKEYVNNRMIGDDVIGVVYIRDENRGEENDKSGSD